MINPLKTRINALAVALVICVVVGNARLQEAQRKIAELQDAQAKTKSQVTYLNHASGMSFAVHTATLFQMANAGCMTQEAARDFIKFYNDDLNEHHKKVESYDQ